jgi:hypothetical protein
MRQDCVLSVGLIKLSWGHLFLHYLFKIVFRACERFLLPRSSKPIIESQCRVVDWVFKSIKILAETIFFPPAPLIQIPMEVENYRRQPQGR